MFIAGAGAVGRVGRPGLSGNGARRPSFDVDFVGSGSLGAGAVFTRASVGTYYNSSGVLVSAAINTPRFDYDPVTLQLKGLLLEDASTNIWLQSGDAGNASWNKVAAGGSSAPVVTSNQVAAPDGTTTASRVVYPAVSGAGAVSVMYQNFTVTTTAYAFSIWLRGNVGGEQLYLSVNTPFAASPRLTLTTQWQRFVLITPTLAAAFFQIGTDLRDTNQASTPAQTIYAWGAQVEALPYMSSHIPTTSVSVTRARDTLSYPIASVTGFSPVQGSLVTEFIYNGQSVGGFGSVVALIAGDGSADHINQSIQQSNGSFTANIKTGGTQIYVSGAAANTTLSNAISKTGMAYAPNVGKAVVNGVMNGAAASSGTPPVATSLAVMAFGINFQLQLTGWQRRISYWPRVLSDSEMQAATTLAGPTLSLDFMQPGTLDPRMVFTRASSATYTDASGVIQTAAINAPRWDYANGVLRGLLIEEQRTNVLAFSNDFTQSFWTKAGVTAAAPTVTGNQTTAPDGTLTASRFVIPAVSGAGSVSIVYASYPASAAVYTFSVYMKGNVGGEQVYIEASTAGTTFFASPRLTLTTQWQRFSFTTPTLTAAVWIFAIGTDRRDTNQADTPAQTIFAWGAQVEQGAFATSAIVTTSAAVTRAADVATMTDAVVFQAPTGNTLLVEAFAVQPTPAGQDVAWIDLRAGAPTNLLQFHTGPSSSDIMSVVLVGGTTFVNGANVTVTRPSVFKAAVANSTVWRGAVNGALVPGSDGASALGSGAYTVMNLGGSGTTQINGYIRRVTYWNRALSDTEMQQVTT